MTLKKSAVSRLALFLSIPLLTACAAGDNVDSSDETAAQITDLKAELSELKEIIDAQSSTIDVLESEIEEKDRSIKELSQEFSYLETFTTEEMTAYEQFLETREVSYLKNYSPENMMLLYFHSIVENDLETLHQLTYDNGSLPDIDVFKQAYLEEGDVISAKDSVLQYRDYDFIKVKEEHRTDDYVAVEIKGSYGTYGFITIYGLKKDEGIWKMDTLDML